MSDDDEGWRFELSDLPPLEDEAGQTVAVDDGDPDERAAEPEASDDGGNVAGAFTAPTEPEPESPDAENVAFVLLGVVITVAVFVAPVLNLASPRTLAAVVVAVLFGVGAVVLNRTFGTDRGQ